MSISGRLEKARSQYENLLVHAEEISAGEVLSSPSRPTKSLLSSFDESPFIRRAQTPERSFQYASMLDSSASKIAKNIASTADINSDTVVALQDEIERLKTKLNHVLTAAEETMSETRINHDALVEDFREREEELVQRLQAVEEDNTNLRAALAEAQKETVFEREQLSKSVSQWASREISVFFPLICPLK
jgi:hypothetical protein